MADSTISQLPAAVSLSSTDLIPVDQGGVTKRATLAMLGNGTVIVAPGKTLTVNNTLTFVGTDGTTLTFPATSATLARTDAAQSFTGLQTFSDGITAPQITSTVATGTAPLVVTSTTPVANLSIGGNAATSSSTTGNAATATALQNARTIDGVSFDGTANILVVAPATTAALSKATPIDADELPLVDSASAYALAKLTWANLKTTLLSTWKDTTGGFAGLTLFAINFKNVANTFTSFLTNSNTAARTYTFQDRTGTIADLADIANATSFPFRNRIINGDFSVSQVNASTAVTVTAAAALQYVIDQWYAYCTGANVTGQRVAGTGQDQYRYQFTGAASVTAIGFAQRIEQGASYDMNGQTTMIGVDMSNSLLTSVTYTVNYANTADTFGSLASPTVTQIATGTITVSSTLTRYYIPISVPAAATTGIEIKFSVGAQTSGTWVIGKAQFEIVPSGATVGTAFEQLPYATQLIRCQRYLPVVITGTGGDICSSSASTTTNSICLVTFPVQTRAPITGVSIDTPANLAIFDTAGHAVSAYAFSTQLTSGRGAVFSVTHAATTAGFAGFLYITGQVKIYFTGAQL